LKGIIFDLDGTIVDAPYDWALIRAKLGVEGESILAFLERLKEPDKSRKWGELKDFEARATKQASLKPGMKRWLKSLARQGIKTALVSNNTRENVDFLRRKFDLAFDVVLTREAGLWKPSGAPFLEAMRRLGLEKEDCIVVGDSHYDAKAAADAGIGKIFLLKREKNEFFGDGVELCASVEDLKRKVERLIDASSS
jgi:HAD superfamily hydrolase (TIGR01549 family)